MEHGSIADINEHDFVDRLLSNAHLRANFFAVHGMPNQPLAAKRLQLADAPGDAFGDVDILAFAESEPERSVAFEVKRVKIGASSFVSDMPNKLHEIRKAARQANLLEKLGFSQVYLLVIIAVDSRENNAGEITYAGMTDGLRDRVNAELTIEHLNARVGLMATTFVQPMDDQPFGTGSVASNLIRLATVAEQPQALTEWIRTVATPRAI